nr:YccF domain-containing protein [uncultured Carboxylicivirga sp.]
MSFLGNIIWLIFGGFMIAIEYFISSLVLMLTIVGIPFGLQTMKLGILALWPFGTQVGYNPQASGCLSTIMNVIWLIFGGFIIALTHVFWGIILAITIIGIPFARQHFKLAGVALTPFGRTIN